MSSLTLARRFPGFLLLALLGCLALPTGGFAQGEPKPAPEAGEIDLDKLAGIDESDEKAVELIDRYLGAIGGKDSLAAIKDRVERFTNKKLTPTGETLMKMSRFLERPVKIREEWELPDGMGLTNNGVPLTFTQVYDGNEAWVKAMGYVSSLTGKTLTVFVWDKHIDDFFSTWKENGWTAKYVGAEERNGKPVEVAELHSFAGNQVLRYTFSAEDGLLLSKVWSEGAPPAVISKEVTFDDYLPIRFRDDPSKFVRHATTQRIFEDGELTLEKNYTEIVLNGGLPASTFARPEGPSYDPAIIGQGAAAKEGDSAEAEPPPAEEKKPVWEKPQPKKPQPKKPQPKKPTPKPEGS